MNDPFDPRLAQLLRRERARPDPAPSTKARVLARLHATVAVPSTPPSTGPGGTTPALGSRSFARMAITSIAVGVAAGTWLALHAQRSGAHVDSVTSGARIALDLGGSPAPRTNPASSVAVAAAPHPEPPSWPASPASNSGSASAADLTAERLLLDRARTDVLHGEPAAALTSIGLHARRFPRGVLSEERDALRVEALVAADRPEEARSAASRFHAAYPDSVLTAAVDAALESIP